ncbi:hypothetical protein J2Y48_001574 [Mycoplana sp. BE70]|uniref:hypothetical protein n=1 Tax=Mycoplana sp. BE70 TaxID=2817775 RepID=UPI00286136BE|nr:hypothetical protein [Mycoplana sp. BE70]MDR6756284.1 hypothetical protein [Mycoplana sp. BE70]
MDTLAFKVAVRMAIGFAIGAATQFALIYLDPVGFGHGRGINTVGLCLQLWSFIPFAVGYLTTSIALERSDHLF